MEDRIYTFYDKYQKVRYENVTAEELDFLNKSYNKDKYLMRDQYIRQRACPATVNSTWKPKKEILQIILLIGMQMLPSRSQARFSLKNCFRI